MADTYLNDLFINEVKGALNAQGGSGTGNGLPGKNCTIQSVTPTAGGNNVTFAWTADDGTARTQTMFVADGEDGKSCAIQSITPVDGGNNVVFAWADGDGNAQTQTLFVADGKAFTYDDFTPEQLENLTGDPGPGVPAGGTAGQVLAKASEADHDTEWVDPPETGVTSFNGRSGAVVPAEGDYTPEQVGADPAGAAADSLTEAKKYTDEKVAALVDSAPETLDTLAEVAQALKDNDDVVAALNAAVGNKQDKQDDTLTTTDKTIAGAINELDAEIGVKGVKGVEAVEEAYISCLETDEGALLVVADDTADIDTTTQITVTDANQYGGLFVVGDYVKYQAPVGGVPGVPGTGLYGYVDDILENAGALKGQDGVSPIATATRQDGGVLIKVTDVYGTTSALVEDGEKGYSPTVAENADNTDEIYKLDITTETESYTTPNLIGKQGAQGIQGEKGLQGDKGAPGTPGEDGVSPAVTENVDNDGSVYKLDITTADGTFTTPNLIGAQGIQGIQGEKGDPGERGEQGIQGIQGIPGERGADGYPFLIYKEYTSLDEFDAADFPEIGLMFMVKTEGADSQPVYRFTGEADTPYSHITDMATTEGLKGEKGDKGDQGEQGIQGEKGDPGKDGFTYKPVVGTVTTVDATRNAEVDILTDEASQSATFNFRIPRGSVGQQGLTGKTGATGETGAAGKDGTTYTPEIGTVNTVEANNDAKASIELEENRAKFNFDIPKGVGVKSIEFTSTTDESGEAGKPGATDTYTITYTNNQKTTYNVFNGRDGDARIDDTTTSDTTVWSSSKVDSAKQDNLTIYRSHILSGDINDLTESGFYSVGDAAQWKNIPENKYGTLLVMASHLYIVQMFLRTNKDGTGFFYVRMRTENTWGAWVKLF